MKKAFNIWLLGALVVVAGLFSVRAMADEEPAADHVRFYDNSTCSGGAILELDRGWYNDFRDFKVAGGTWNDRVSCIWVGPGVKVTVYQKVNFGGKSKTYTRQMQNGQIGLSGDWWDNSVSSVKITSSSN